MRECVRKVAVMSMFGRLDVVTVHWSAAVFVQAVVVPLRQADLKGAAQQHTGG